MVNTLGFVRNLINRLIRHLDCLDGRGHFYTLLTSFKWRALNKDIENTCFKANRKNQDFFGE